MSYLRRFILMLLDVFLLVFSLWLAFFLRFEGRLTHREMDLFFVGSLGLVACFLPLAVFFGLYRSIWRYASLRDYLSIPLTISLAMLPLVLGRAFQVLSIPYGVLGINWFTSLMTIGGVRVAYRLIQELSPPQKKETKRILIVGAGQAGAMLLRELRSPALKQRYAPVGFIDDDPAKRGCAVNGLRVLGGREKIPQIVRENKIDEIFVAIPSAPPRALREIVSLCRTTKAKVKTLPGLYQLVEGRVSVKDLREVAIEDLLGRAPVAVDLDEIASYLCGETVLVTGAGGSIGSELCRQIARFNPQKLLLLGRGEHSIYQIHLELTELFPHLRLRFYPLIGDVRDRARMELIFAGFRPGVIFHAAAHKHVPLMEEAPDEAIKNNVFGTLNVAELAHEYGAKSFVLISTDKAVRPTSVMGATKRLAELVIQDLATRSKTRFCAVRFGNGLGSRGSVVPLFQRQIARGGPVTVTDERMVRYFMTIPEAASLVIQAGAMGKGGEIFVLDMGEPVRIVDLARELIRLSGLEPGKDIEIVFTGPRPGEKLLEEVLTDKEGMMVTQHERIFIAPPDPVPPDELTMALAQLQEALAEPAACLAALRRLVPEYSPSTGQGTSEAKVRRFSVAPASKGGGEIISHKGTKITKAEEKNKLI
ncbi:MAG: polysaccharide biosynthesis protein [Firmicutes bacterium]|nr:polysaccharide biosynthesis protein [Bacillota bacterium]